MATGALAYFQVCTVATNPCPLANQATVQGYLIDSVNAPLMDVLLTQSGIDWQSVYDAFGMSLFMFATGLGVGLIFNIVKKLR